MDTAPAHLVLSNLSKRYGVNPVLADVSLSIGKGELVTLLGPSGCGKTTLLRAVAGLALPDEGRVELGGRDITREPPHKRRVGVVFQNYALFPHLNVAGNVAFGLKLMGKSRAEIGAAVTRALDLVQLGALAERPIKALSGGQQQRVALARALAVEPRVILFDEALSALDRKLRETMQEELRALLTGLGTTTIFVTHDQDEALTMSDRIAVMHRGRIEQLADPRTLYDRPATPFALNFVGRSVQVAGRVTGAEAGVSLVDTPVGRLRVPKTFATGTPVLVATRPEHVRLGAGDNTLSARVASVTFHGPRSLVGLAAGDLIFSAELSGRETPPQPGETVSVGWALQDTLAFAQEEAA